MSFEYPCFISYRHGQRKLAERIITDLYEAIDDLLDFYLGKQVYFDRARLQGGEFYNENLAHALCHSVCMILVYTPAYFDKNHPYCAREYKAMVNLETERLKVLGEQGQRNRGLIIPIVFRGVEYLPAEIKNHRQYYNFEGFLESDDNMSRDTEYGKKIKEIAIYVADRYLALDSMEQDFCSGCEQFSLPDEEEVMPWLNEVTKSRISFPLRK